MVVFKMLHTLIHFVALTKPSNLLLRGKRGITRFCPAKEGELYHSYWQWGKYEGDKFLMPSFTCSCFSSPVPKGDQDVNFQDILLYTAVSEKQKLLQNC